MSGICDKCRREPCRMRMDSIKMCDLYECGETNWERLFGTPERAAQTLFDFGSDVDYDALLEWLKGDT